jgi:hypothetical protein
MGTSPTPIPAAWTQQAVALNTLAADSNYAAQMTQNRLTLWQQGYAAWAAQVAAGAIPNTNPPAIPPSVVIGPSDPFGFPTFAQGPPVATMPSPLPVGPGANISMPTNAGFVPEIGQSIDPPAGAPDYPLGQTFAEPTPTGTIYFLVNQANSPFFPGLVKTIWTRVAGSAANAA